MTKKLNGPSYGEAAHKLEFFFAQVNEIITLKVLDPDNCHVDVKIQDTNDPLRKRFELLPDIVGKYTINIYGSTKDKPLEQKEFFCYNLSMECWQFKELHGSLDDVHILMETRLHRQLMDKISAQAHLMVQDSDKTDQHTAVQCNLTSTSDFKCDFSFTPPQYGTYEIMLFCAHKSINKPRPIIHVVDYSKFKLVHSFTTERYLISVKEKVSFIFDLSGASSNYLKASINCPDKKKVEMLLYGEEKAEKIGQLRSDFVPSNIGVHTLLAYYGDEMFDKCPLIFQVYNASLVTVAETRPSLTSNFHPNDTLVITYDCSRCGPGFLDISAFVNHGTGNPSSVHVDKKVSNKQALVICTIKLSFHGKYVIDASYNNEVVQDVSLSLLVQAATEESKTNIPQNLNGTLKAIKQPLQKSIASDTLEEKPINRENVSTNNDFYLPSQNDSDRNVSGPIVFGRGLLHAEMGNVAMFTVDPKEESGKLVIDVQGPKSLAKCLIRPEPQSSCYNVEYYPNEIGVYIIRILWNTYPISGSPFHVTVTDPPMIRCIDYPDIFEKPIGIVKDKKTQLDFDSSKAGNGKLSAILKRDHEQIKLKCWSNKTKTIWSFFVESNTDEVVKIDVFWNDILLGESVLKCREYNDLTDGITNSTADNGLQVILKGRGMKEAWVGEPSEFIVDTLNAGYGNLIVELSNAIHSSDKIPVEIVPTNNGEYRCIYTPDSSGEFLLKILWGKKTVKGSPFHVKICERGSLQNYNDSHTYGFVGEETTIDLNVDLPIENENLLTVSCIGQEGKTIICHLEKLGSTIYQVKLMADVSGIYQLIILYNQIDISGSPFPLTILDRNNVSKIVVFGLGLLSSNLNQIDSRFTIDTRNAGQGRLTVQVKGPQESFRVEIQKDPTNNRLIHCSYNPMTTGEYIITVSWNDSLTRGSPFHVFLS